MTSSAPKQTRNGSASHCAWDSPCRRYGPVWYNNPYTLPTRGPPPCTFRTSSPSTAPRSASSSFRRRATRPGRNCSSRSRRCRNYIRRSFASPTGPAARPATARTTSSSASRRKPNLTAVSHLTCVCHSLEEMTGDPRPLRRRAGIENILALGGDPPKTLANYDRSQGRVQVRRGTRQASSAVAAERSGPTRLRRRRRRLSRRAPRHARTACKEMDYLKRKSRRGGGLHLHTVVFREPRLLRFPRTLRTGRDQGADYRRHHAGEHE